MSTQANVVDQRPYKLYRNRRGWVCWYQRWAEAWWIVSGKWTLHRIWQDGVTQGAQAERHRIIINGGDLHPIMAEIVDATWGRAMEDGSVPSSKIAGEVMATAWQETLRKRALGYRTGEKK